MRRTKYFKIVPFVFMPLIFLIIYVSGSHGDENKLPPDSVKISGKYYQIVYPWLGHKIGDKSDSIPGNLSMIQQAEKDGVFFKARSGFRSYSYQAQLFAARMAKGRSFEHVAKNIAPPGYSQHMLGTAFDLATDTVPFADSKAYRWLKVNAGNYGFIESYPENSELGFSWEAWHWRYIGVDNDTLR